MEEKFVKNISINTIEFTVEKCETYYNITAKVKRIREFVIFKTTLGSTRFKFLNSGSSLKVDEFIIKFCNGDYVFADIQPKYDDHHINIMITIQENRESPIELELSSHLHHDKMDNLLHEILEKNMQIIQVTEDNDMRENTIFVSKLIEDREKDEYYTFLNSSLERSRTLYFPNKYIRVESGWLSINNRFSDLETEINHIFTEFVNTLDTVEIKNAYVVKNIDKQKIFYKHQISFDKYHKKLHNTKHYPIDVYKEYLKNHEIIDYGYEEDMLIAVIHLKLVGEIVNIKITKYILLAQDRFYVNPSVESIRKAIEFFQRFMNVNSSGEKNTNVEPAAISIYLYNLFKISDISLLILKYMYMKICGK